jgi:hypothetical protein
VSSPDDGATMARRRSWCISTDPGFAQKAADNVGLYLQPPENAVVFVVDFHFTPTHASWLNQVEVWFSILSAKALAGASFASPRQVRDQIDAFIKAYNQTAHPFEWTKQVVFSQHPRAKYADL